MTERDVTRNMTEPLKKERDVNKGIQVSEEIERESRRRLGRKREQAWWEGRGQVGCVCVCVCVCVWANKHHKRAPWQAS